MYVLVSAANVLFTFAAANRSLDRHYACILHALCMNTYSGIT
jgi:hypothetical protein